MYEQVTKNLILQTPEKKPPSRFPPPSMSSRPRVLLIQRATLTLTYSPMTPLMAGHRLPDVHRQPEQETKIGNGPTRGFEDLP